MDHRVLFGLTLVFIAVPAWAQESLLDVVLKRDKVIVATYSKTLSETVARCAVSTLPKTR